ncbi:MAG: hypothetical protein R3Y39_05755 [Rikenellaceae bacterium]
MRKFTLTAFLLSALFSVGAQTQFHVSPSAADGGKGTLESPFNTIEAAKQKVAKVNKKMTEDIVVYLHGGTYYISSPIRFTESDSGTNGHTITYKAYEDETPIISGGVKVTGWESVGGNIYKARLDSDDKQRTLFMDGERMRMAGVEEPVYALSGWGEYEVTGDEPWAFGSGVAIDGIKFMSKDLLVYHNPEDVELVQTNTFHHKIMGIREVEKMAETTVLKLQQPYGAIASNLAWMGRIDYTKPFVIRNAYELLDSEGEFYFNKATKTLYVYNAKSDMSGVEVIAPLSDGLMSLEGSSNDSRIKNIGFEGITFTHDHWQLMEVEGSRAFAGIQSHGLACKYIPGGNWHPTEYNSCNVPRGAVEIKNAENITFELNCFEGLGSASAINMVNDVKNSKINANYFHDLLGNAVNIGHPQHYKIGDGPLYAPGVEGLCEGIYITNNYLRNVCIDFRQLEGMSAFFVADVHFDYNDIANTPYCAIAMGWWWGNSGIEPSKVAKNNSMSFNRAGNTHLSLKDGGILYFLGEQPGTVAEENYIFKGPRCIYADDGSAYLTIRRNVAVNNYMKGGLWLNMWRFACHDILAEDNFVKDNIVRNNGTNCTVRGTQAFMTSDFSDEAKEIMERSGIQDEYKYIIPEEEDELIQLYPLSFKDVDE